MGFDRDPDDVDPECSSQSIHNFF